jgi:hypothetical protein
MVGVRGGDTAMKLYNKTKIPDSVLYPLLVSAGRAVGAKTNVVVKVTQGRRAWVSGHAKSACFVYSWHLNRRRIKRGCGGRRIATNGGYFQISVPYVPMGQDALTLAESFFRVALHEWVHIRDFQHGGSWRLPWSSGRNGRRPKHDKRPEELRAINAVDDAEKKGIVHKHADKVIALALALEDAS